MRAISSRAVEGTFGHLLQHWRRVRGKSQLELAVEATVSPRHVSFVETGRATPSREMVLTLATALQVPLRERNTLLVAAGYAPVFREAQLDDAELAPVRQALQLILRQQEPYPAVVLNRRWDIVTSNDAASQFFGWLLGGSSEQSSPANVLRLIFAPAGLRPHVANWAAVAENLIQRVHREAVGGITDEATKAIVAEVLAYPGVPARWGKLDPTPPLSPIVPVVFEKDGLTLRYFSMVTTLGTPQDVTLQELRVECFFPADEETARQAVAFRARAP